MNQKANILVLLNLWIIVFNLGSFDFWQWSPPPPLFEMSMNQKTIIIFHQQSLQHVLNIVKQSSLCIYRCVKHILFIMLNIVFCREAATVTVLTGLTVWERFAPWPTVALTSCRCSILRRTVLLGKMIGIPYKNFQGIWMIGFRSNFVSVTVNGVEQC